MNGAPRDAFETADKGPHYGSLPPPGAGSGVSMQRMSPMRSLSPTRMLSSISQTLDAQVPPGSIRGSTFTLLTAIVGAGILSLPYAFREAGLVPGVVLVALCALIAWFSIHLLIVSTSASGKMSYQSLGEHCGGPRLRVFTQVCLLLNLFGTTVAYTIASGKLLSDGIRAVYHDTSAYTSPKFIACACFFAATLPLSLMRQVSSLRFSSLLAVLCSCYLAVILVVEYFVKSSAGDVRGFWHGIPFENLVPSSPSQFFRALPIVVYAYTCHPNVLPIYLELKRPSERRVHRVLTASIVVAMSLYVVVSAAGYLTFLDATQGNILQLDGFHDARAVLVAVFGMEIAVLSAIPLFIHAWRANAEAGFFRDREHSTARHVALTVLPLGGALAIALCVNELAPVFSFLGSTTNPVICYVLPAHFYLRTHAGDGGASPLLARVGAGEADARARELERECVDSAPGDDSFDELRPLAAAPAWKRAAAVGMAVGMVLVSAASLLAQFGVF